MLACSKHIHAGFVSHAAVSTKLVDFQSTYHWAVQSHETGERTSLARSLDRKRGNEYESVHPMLSCARLRSWGSPMISSVIDWLRCWWR